MEHAYASAILSLIRKGAAPEAAVAAVREALLRRGRLKLFPKIAGAFLRLAAKEEASRAATLTIAKEEDREAALAEARRHVPEGSAITVRIDPSAIGGWRLVAGGTLVDATFKKHLLSIYDRTVSGLSMGKSVR